MNTNRAWNDHYERPKAKLSYPDENLVRLLANAPRGAALDLGCGSGRHLALLDELGFSPLSGVDASETSVRLCRSLFPGMHITETVASETGAYTLPFKDHEFAIVVTWGVLHYNDAASRASMLSEIKRVLQPEGRVLGTLRAASDTHFSSNTDINTAEMHYFNEEQTRAELAPHFSHVELGYMERAPMGQLERRVSHWIFQARNEEPDRT